MKRGFLHGFRPAVALAGLWLACSGGGESEPAFAITAVAPARGSTLGGTAVAVSGRGFAATAIVTFDGTPAPDVVVVSANEIRCATPPHASGPVTVAVENAASQIASAPGAFTFDAPPTAVARWDRIVTPGVTVGLDGAASTDPDSAALVHAWTLDRPDGSAATLSGASSATPSFVVDVPGTYVATLVVDDGTSASAPASVTVRTSGTASLVPDTGAAACSGATGTVACPSEGAAYFGQDASYVLVPQRLTVSAETVLDEVTGLTWERADEGQYSWFEAAGAYDAIYNVDGVDVCGALELGGFSDWRLPSAHELYSLVSLAPGAGGLDRDAFPGLGGGPYWTTTDDRCVGPDVLYCPPAQIAFPAASYGYGHRMDPMWVVCVRGAAWGVNAFVDPGDGTVRDDGTGLVWEKAPDPAARSWRNALVRCEGLVLGGRDDWRLPSAKELQTLVMPMDLGPFAGMSGDYWTSTADGGGAWNVDFSVESMDMNVLAASLLVRCVR